MELNLLECHTGQLMKLSYRIQMKPVKKNADYYLSWGWQDEKSSHVIPFPSTQLAGTKK
jgi:hypothetical protein